jgi:hypothetical protein
VDETYEVTTEDGEVYEVTVAEESPSDSSGLALAAAGQGVRGAANVAMRVATNPNIAKTGRVVGQAAGGILGMIKGGPIGAAGGMYAGGRIGGPIASAVQGGAAPIARLMGRLAPYAQTLSTLGGMQGVSDLAQMAEPGRMDTSAIGASSDVPGAEAPIVNRILGRLTGNQAWTAKYRR